MGVQASVIVPLQGGPEQALRCFRSLAQLPEHPEHEVIVVDDASVGLDDLLARLSGDVEVVRSQRRAGLAASFALAAERARGDVLVLLDGAPEVAGDFLPPLLGALARDDVAVATSLTAGEPGTHPVAARAVAVRRSDVAAIGPLPRVPEGLELAALCAELQATGRRALPVEASVVHPASARAAGARRAPGEELELTVVIPTLDVTSDRVRACASAVQRATDAAHEIVVVDNGAPAQGFTEPVNAGIRAARTPYVVVMNDDVETLPGWWAPLREALDTGAEVVFPHTVEGFARRDFAAWCFAFDAKGRERWSHAPDHFFDPAFTVWYQDTDLLIRMKAEGTSPQLVESSLIRHGVSETVASEDPALRAWIDAQIRVDKERFAAKHPQVRLQSVDVFSDAA